MRVSYIASEILSIVYHGMTDSFKAEWLGFTPFSRITLVGSFFRR